MSLETSTLAIRSQKKWVIDPGAESGDVHLQNELEGIFPQWPSAKEEGRNLPISKGYISNHRIENELVLLFIAR